MLKALLLNALHILQQIILNMTLQNKLEYVLLLAPIYK